MGRRTRIKLIIRTILLIVMIVFSIVDINLVSKFMSLKLIGSFKLYQLLWLYLMYEMVIVLIPKFNNYSYSGKIFKRHFIEADRYNSEKLEQFTEKNSKKAVNAFIFWVGLNGIIGFIYLKFNLSPIYMYLLFFFYYWADMFCVNIWCPFHKIIVRNKCCNECRIYNWGHIMYLTPLVFIPSFYTYSLVFVGVVLFLQWEYMYRKYPERVSSISNKTLSCGACSHDCRYNKAKRLDRAKNKSKQ